MKGPFAGVVVLAAWGLLAAAMGRSTREPQGRVLFRKSLRAEALGCFTLLDSAKKSPATHLEGAPAMVRLDNTPARIGSGVNPEYRLLVTFGQDERFALTARRIGMAQNWRADSLSDTIRFAFSNGFTGSEFIFYLAAKGRPDTLSGRAFTFGDVSHSQRDEGRAWAIRAECPAPEVDISMLKRKTLRQDVVGCYALLDSNKTQWEGAAFEDIPDVVRLDSMLAVIDKKRDDRWRSIESIFYDEYFGYTRKKPRVAAQWAVDSVSDSVRISFFNGLSGTVFSFFLPRRITQDTLRGRATMLMDVNPFSYDMGRAWAVRRRCPQIPGPFSR